MTDKRILITGGTGFVGGALCTRMLADGWRVDVLTRDVTKARRLLPDAVGAVADCAELPAAPDAIVNLAGENLGAGRWNERRKREFLDSRVGVTEHVVDYIAESHARPGVLVSGSAVGYYGARGDEEIGEDEPPGDEFQSEVCRAWENAAERASEYGVRVCLVRSGLVLDAGGGPLQQMLLPFKLGLGGPLGSGRQWMPWIHRTDLLRAIRFLIEREDCSGPYNATAPQTVTNAEFGKALGRALHRPAIARMPGPVLRLAVGEMAHLLLTGQRVVPRRLLEAGFRFEYPDLDAAFAEILDAA